ncbi:MAG: TIGR03620 family F420-dependent LLM class oxidoreductase [bacterium]|nr:LLM class F420-dependent oxidoreductase [Deltaproteobacteria bacterium]MCP4907902.1 TIGR03620 family F420-dependent LLM class oxidoreductase [bacterium]
MNLEGRGVWFYPDGLTSDETVEFAQRLEEMGYTALWLPDAGGRDPFALAARLLDHTERLVLATGVANVYARDPLAMRSAQLTLAEQSGGRFILGIGISHRVLVEDVRGHVYGKPLASMREYLAGMKAAQYVAIPPAEEPPTLLAALGPKMLEIARDEADGAHPYMVTPEHTRRARAILGPDKLLCTEQKVVLEPDRAKALEIARATAAIAMGLTLPNYQNNLIRLGFDARDFEGGVSERVIDAIVAMGDVEALDARVEAHHEAGASHVCIHPIHPDGESKPYWPALEALAPKG